MRPVLPCLVRKEMDLSLLRSVSVNCPVSCHSFSSPSLIWIRHSFFFTILSRPSSSPSFRAVCSWHCFYAESVESNISDFYLAQPLALLLLCFDPSIFVSGLRNSPSILDIVTRDSRLGTS